MFREPGAPAPRYTPPCPHHQDRDSDAEGGKRNEYPSLVDDRRRVLLLQRVEDFAIPDVDSIARNDLQHDEHDEAHRHQPGDTTLIAAPESTRLACKAPHQRSFHFPV